jgi:hypothetical protein
VELACNVCEHDWSWKANTMPIAWQSASTYHDCGMCVVLGRIGVLVNDNKQKTSRRGRYRVRGEEEFVSVEQDKDGAGYLIRVADWVHLTVSVCGGAKSGKINN